MSRKLLKLHLVFLKTENSTYNSNKLVLTYPVLQLHCIRRKLKQWWSTIINITYTHLSNQWIRLITKLPNTEQSSKGKVKTHKSINRQNQSTTGQLALNTQLILWSMIFAFEIGHQHTHQFALVQQMVYPF